MGVIVYFKHNKGHVHCCASMQIFILPCKHFRWNSKLSNMLHVLVQYLETGYFTLRQFRKRINQIRLIYFVLLFMSFDIMFCCGVVGLQLKYHRKVFIINHTGFKTTSEIHDSKLLWYFSDRCGVVVIDFYFNLRNY